MSEKNTMLNYDSKAGIKYAIRILRGKDKDFWFHWWTPSWHRHIKPHCEPSTNTTVSRGPYVTIGLWIIAIYRGY